MTICYEEPTTANIVVASILIGGIALSYVPQYISIAKAKSSAGISSLTVGLLLLGGLLTLINSGILKWDKVICCGSIHVDQCLGNNLPVIQLFIGPFCIFLLFIFVLIYFDTKPSSDDSLKEDKKRDLFRAWGIFLGTLTVSIIVAVAGSIMYYVIHLPGEVLFTYAKVLGYIASALVLLQWTPQIITTFRAKSGGTLSLAMLAVQMPGAVVVSYYQGVLNHADFSTWAPYVLTAIQQVILIVMLVVFMIRDKKKKRLAMESGVYEREVLTDIMADNEKSRLLDNTD
jgi:uncharacterized protein with PQ loop repeat